MNTLDTLYTDFVTKMLPQIQEGLVITKDYFTDLFGRYVTYLMITDIITIALLVIFFIGSVWASVKSYKIAKEDDDDGIFAFTCVVFVILSVVQPFIIVEETLDLVKLIYIPEVRIYQELQGVINNNM